MSNFKSSPPSPPAPPVESEVPELEERRGVATVYAEPDMPNTCHPAPARSVFDLRRETKFEIEPETLKQYAYFEKSILG